jgi:hypothetical protein
MNFVPVAEVGRDRVFRIGEVEIVIAGAQKNDAISTADLFEVRISV